MSQHDLNEVIAASITGRAELLFAIAHLVDEVAQLASNVDRIVATADARRTQSEPTEAPHLVAACARKMIEAKESELQHPILRSSCWKRLNSSFASP